MPEKTVIFPFSPGDKVATPVGTEGIIDSCCVDGEDTQLFLVDEPAQTRWWKTKQLSLVTEDAVSPGDSS